MWRKFWRAVAAVFVITIVVYGGVRLWFHYTDGFRIVHITSDFSHDPRWETRELTSEEQKKVEVALSQSYTYLGKGCQSYVFASEDGEYVLKFFKYKRYRPQFYFYWFTFLPYYQEYLDRKIDSKQQQLDRLFTSSTIGFDHLPKETALVYIHLNKTDYLNKRVKFRDKIGREHELEMDSMEFMIQRRGEMLCPVIDQMMAEGKEEQAKQMLSGLFEMILAEYRSGLADTDHALMQNTGVIDGRAFQLDVGRFVADPIVANPDYYHQEIFNKFYLFREWLGENHPSLLGHVNAELEAELKEGFYTIPYIPSK